jgi:glutathione S-transferase
MTESITQGLSTAGLSLYHSSTCWFCAKVRQKLSVLGVDIELRDIGVNDGFREELVREAGKGQVPCLRIEQQDAAVKWMYESSDICSYLDQHFGNASH